MSCGRVEPGGAWGGPGKGNQHCEDNNKLPAAYRRRQVSTSGQAYLQVNSAVFLKNQWNYCCCLIRWHRSFTASEGQFSQLLYYMFIRRYWSLRNFRKTNSIVTLVWTDSYDVTTLSDACWSDDYSTRTPGSAFGRKLAFSPRNYVFTPANSTHASVMTNSMGETMVWSTRATDNTFACHVGS